MKVLFAITLLNEGMSTYTFEKQPGKIMIMTCLRRQGEEKKMNDFVL